MKLASRMSKLGTETAFEVLVKANALAATGVDVVHLELGEPDFDTPATLSARQRMPWMVDSPTMGPPPACLMSVLRWRSIRQRLGALTFRQTTLSSRRAQSR